MYLFLQLCSHLFSPCFHRAEPPEIVSKTTTTNIFGSSNTEEDQQDDFISPVDTSDKNSPRRFVSYDELRQKNRTEHATKFSGTKVRNGLYFVSSLFPSYFLFFLDSPASNTQPNAPVQDNRRPASLSIISNEPAPKPISTNPAKRSNARKNQYGDEVYE